MTKSRIFQEKQMQSARESGIIQKSKRTAQGVSLIPSFLGGSLGIGNRVESGRPSACFAGQLVTPPP